MNLTLEQFLTGLERTGAEIGKLLDDWPGVDDDLREEYASQLGWMVGEGWDHAVRAAESLQGPSRDAAVDRMSRAGEAILAHRDRVVDLTGVDLRSFVPSFQRASELAV